MSKHAKSFITDLLRSLDIQICGSRPWDIRVRDDRLYSRLLTQGSLGLGEGYMDGWWDSDAVDEMVFRLLAGDIRSKIRFDISLIPAAFKGLAVNAQRLRKMEVGEKHYDIGNELYAAMLDTRMIYSCGYWRNANTLDEAQEAKLDLICRKIGLKSGMRVLDIGSGWGGFLNFAAERYGAEGVGVTVSRKQVEYAEASKGDLPIETRLMDYMDIDGQFDRVVSVGMFEHVGYKNYRGYLQKVRHLLAPDGLFLLHAIGGNSTLLRGDPWMDKYIFPNGMLPSPRQVTTSAEGLFVMEDWHNFGADYDRTLMAWHKQFEAAWPSLRGCYDERFYRMWRYYLLACAAVFRTRNIQLWQLVYSPSGIVGGYRSIR